jgi:hypothetical protein
MESQEITIPKKPRINLKPQIPYIRKVSIMPSQAIMDRRVTHMQFRVLATYAMHANRAGITWVGQLKVSEESGIDQSQVSKAFSKLVEYGFIEILRKGYRDKFNSLIRIVFDKNLTVQDAVSIAQTGTEEDLRPYTWKQKENRAMEKQWKDDEIKANKERLTALVKQAFKTPSEANKQIYKPVKGDTMTVRKMKESLSKTRVKPVDNFVDNSTKPVDNPVDKSVDNLSKDENNLCDSHILKEEKIYIDNVYSVNNKDKVNNICLDKVLTLVLTLDDARARLTEDDIGMLERLVNAGVTESELVQAIAEHKGKSTAAMCREMLLAR